MKVDFFIANTFVPSRLIIAIGPFFAGMLLLSRFMPFDITDYFFTLGALAFADLAASGINSITDLKADAINKPSRFLVNNPKSKPQIIVLIILFMGLSLIFAGTVNSFLIFVVLLRIIFEYAYSGLKLKNVFILNHLLVGITYCAIPLLACIAIEKQILQLPFIPPLFFVYFILTVLLTPLKDIEDYYGDKKNKTFTLPVVIGLTKSKIVLPLLILFFPIILLIIGIIKNDIKLILPSSISIIYLLILSNFIQKQIKLTMLHKPPSKVFTPLATLGGVIIEIIYALF